MKRMIAVAVLGFMVGSIGGSLAQTNGADRNKSGNELSTALNGADRYLRTISNSTDGGGNGEPTCTTVGRGYNVMGWCDAPCYVSNFATGVDGGSLRLAEMVPLQAFSPYPIGLLDVTNGKVCVWQAGDGGTLTVNGNIFRRF